MVPLWLHVLSIVSLSLGLISFVIIAADVVRYPQKMWIMNVVWPVTALFGSLLMLWAYFTYGRSAAMKETAADNEESGASEGHDAPRETPFPVKVGKGALHCGSGCTLGDICAEWLAFLFPVVAIWLGYQTIFETKMFAVWILDYIFAFAFGIAFQYFTIKPMRNLSVGQGLVQAVKADAASLTAWQVGMYGFMAFAYFYIFRHVFAAELKVNRVEFWFMMQIAMLFGLLTSYPVNWWLIRAGVKEAM